MFFLKGAPASTGACYRFVSTTCDDVFSPRFVYTFTRKSSTLADMDGYREKLDRILDLLEEQKYSELNKLIGTMTLKEVASFMNKSTRTIDRRIEKGMLKAVGKEGNADLFHKKDVVELYVTEYKKWPKKMP